MENTTTFTVPSGYEITLREQTGEDDDVISQITGGNDSSAINKFLAGIITNNTNLPAGTTTKHNDVKKMKLKDKYYILLRSRIFSLDPELYFTYKCPSKGCNHTTDQVEDLSKYDWDLTQCILSSDEKGFEAQQLLLESKYADYMIKEYTNKLDSVRTLELRSGKKIKYKYLDGIGEAKALEVKEKDLTRNQELRSRNLELWMGEDDNGKWQMIQNFKPFTARDMKEIRADIKAHDSQFDMLCDVSCEKCGTNNTISLAAQPAFYFPDEL